MVWHRIAPRYLRQDDPDGLTLAYVDRGGRDTGDLFLHLDGRGAVIRFELAYHRFLDPVELYAEWDRVTGLRVGEIDTHGATGSPGPRYAMSAIVRRPRHVSTADLTGLLTYVKRHADALDPRHCQVVVAALRGGIRRATNLERGDDGVNAP